jgi:hypothetical protein
MEKLITHDGDQNAHKILVRIPNVMRPLQRVMRRC